MAPDGMTRAVRQRLGLGRLLPLGEASDGAWLAEKAADAVLRQATAGTAGVRLGSLRIGLADPDAAVEPAVPPPPGALPPGPLRIDAELTATAGGEPLPHRAERLRLALREAASARLGLAVTAVHLRVTDLVEADQELAGTPPDGGTGGGPEESGRAEGGTEAGGPYEKGGGTGTTDAESGGGQAPTDEGADGAQERGRAERAAAAAAAVPGVARLTRVLGAPVHVDDGHVRVEVATAAGHRALAVAIAVRKAVAASLGGRSTVTVLVTRVE
ncbi:nucleopolyhedrovirus P10 family protein [Streptomyces sp. NPDC054887]